MDVFKISPEGRLNALNRLKIVGKCLLVTATCVTSVGAQKADEIKPSEKPAAQPPGHTLVVDKPEPVKLAAVSSVAAPSFQEVFQLNQQLNNYVDFFTEASAVLAQAETMLNTSTNVRMLEAVRTRLQKLKTKIPRNTQAFCDEIEAKSAYLGGKDVAAQCREQVEAEVPATTAEIDGIDTALKNKIIDLKLQNEVVKEAILGPGVATVAAEAPAVVKQVLTAQPEVVSLVIRRTNIPEGLSETDVFEFDSTNADQYGELSQVAQSEFVAMYINNEGQLACRQTVSASACPFQPDDAERLTKPLEIKPGGVYFVRISLAQRLLA